MVIIWSDLAREDLHAIHQYIAHDSKYYAKHVVKTIFDKVTILEELPRIGKKVSEINEENVREISVYSYRIIYEIIQNTIYIHCVIHNRRLLTHNYLQRN
ncbi:hypothetical protein TI05_09840 [Achromatium sp. WMS3]|nr:hypothetical protein TI05_09840 [Achromatium sp. WMS3]